MKNTFFFDPDYEYLAHGQGELKFTTTSLIHFHDIGFFVIFLLLIFSVPTVFVFVLPLANIPKDSRLSFLTEFFPLLRIMAIPIGLMGIALIVFVFYIIREHLAAISGYRRLRDRGVFLNGTIVETKLKFNKYSRLRGPWLDVTYEFTTPNGRILHSHRSQLYTGQGELGAPKPGMPVQVLYADDKTYVVL